MRHNGVKKRKSSRNVKDYRQVSYKYFYYSFKKTQTVVTTLCSQSLHSVPCRIPDQLYGVVSCINPYFTQWLQRNQRAIPIVPMHIGLVDTIVAGPALREQSSSCLEKCPAAARWYRYRHLQHSPPSPYPSPLVAELYKDHLQSMSKVLGVAAACSRSCTASI